MGNCILTRRGGGAWVGIPNFTYTGTYETVDDGDGNWRIKFLTSGVFTLLKPKQLLIDVFCVGGGGGQHEWRRWRLHYYTTCCHY